MKAVFAILLSAVTFLAIAQGTPGYVTDGSGQIVKTGSGLCLHTGTYTPADAVKGCDPVVEPAKAVPVTLKADVLFAFDSFALTDAGRVALTRFADSIKPGDTVTIVGHTDRIGTPVYNQRLSEGRAAAVAQYLNDKVKANYVPSGVGSSQPTEGSNLCVGMKNFQKLVKCYAPDRRVVITVK